jgi:hypothetical protein
MPAQPGSITEIQTRTGVEVSNFSPFALPAYLFSSEIQPRNFIYLSVPCPLLLI